MIMTDLSFLILTSSCTQNRIYQVKWTCIKNLDFVTRYLRQCYDYPNNSIDFVEYQIEEHVENDIDNRMDIEMESDMKSDTDIDTDYLMYNSESYQVQCRDPDHHESSSKGYCQICNGVNYQEITFGKILDMFIKTYDTERKYFELIPQYPVFDQMHVDCLDPFKTLIVFNKEFYSYLEFKKKPTLFLEDILKVDASMLKVDNDFVFKHREFFSPNSNCEKSIVEEQEQPIDVLQYTQLLEKMEKWLKNESNSNIYRFCQFDKMDFVLDRDDTPDLFISTLEFFLKMSQQITIVC
ncbi:hypothetical protein DFA_09946 [Cavenderia fasciculata]|uniref:Uncharacterized protein n=1 Tax=Cavenderia fasciculata TaxID=261658 RepID=F4Q8V3_CACFS|nr:uncharacterized protein DFA_09946 [Cavenderia fasciculata]EGG15122.1 hypothetical protein DFA_09946 [Cavenderia fasciculata]|eukprot:XP_004351842.1 hypothetical protein DFA_09946 [Cavenderia fasciculata]